MEESQSEDWGMQVGTPDLEEVFSDTFSISGVENLSDREHICLGNKIKLPLEILYQVIEFLSFSLSCFATSAAVKSLDIIFFFSCVEIKLFKIFFI